MTYHHDQHHQVYPDRHFALSEEVPFLQIATLDQASKQISECISAMDIGKDIPRPPSLSEEFSAEKYPPFSHIVHTYISASKLPPEASPSRSCCNPCGGHCASCSICCSSRRGCFCRPRDTFSFGWNMFVAGPPVLKRRGEHGTEVPTEDFEIASFLGPSSRQDGFDVKAEGFLLVVGWYLRLLGC